MKKLLSSILAIIMVVSVIFGCVTMLAGCGKDDGDGGKTNTNNGTNNNENNKDKYEGLSDEEYFQVLAADELDAAVGTLAKTWGAYGNLGNIADSFGANVEFDLMLGDMVMDLLEQYAATSLGMEMDLDFLSSIGLGMNIDSKDGLSQLEVGLDLSDTNILVLNMIMSDDAIWAGAPQLSDTFLEAKLDELMVGADTAQLEKLADLIEILPEEKEIDTILTRYLTLALKEIDNVERTQTTLELNGLKQDVTQLNVKIYQQDALDIAKAALTEAKNDQTVKKYIDDLSAFYNDMWREQSIGWEDVDLYAEYTKSLDVALKELPTEAEDTETYIGFTLYIDGGHNVTGCSIAVPEITDAVFTCYTVTEGENFKSLLEVESLGLKVTGEGLNDSGTIDGKYSVEYMGTAYLTIDLKNFSASQYAVKGTVVLTPAQALVDMMSQGEVSIIPVDDIAVEIKLDITDGASNTEIKLIGDDAMIVGIALKLATRSADAIEKPTNTIAVQDETALMQWVSGLNLSAIIDNLREAEVPDTLLTMLQGMIGI